MLSPCDSCPIGDEHFPSIDELSENALAFSCVWDHGAHEGYREALWDLIGPALGPQDAMRWLMRRQAVWETHQKIQAEEMEKRRKEQSNGNQA